MGKATKEVKKNNIETWLLSFEKHIGRSVVVSLLIENNKIEFVSCVDKNRYLNGMSDDEEEGSKSLLKSKKPKVEVPAMKVAQSYIM